MLKKTTLFIVLVALSFVQINAQAPTVAAAVPTNAEADVISVYSDAFTSLYSDLSGSWSDSEHTEIMIGSDSFIEYTVGGGNNQKASIDLTSGQNCTAMEYLHIDYFTNDASTLLLFNVFSGGDATYYNMAGDGGGVVAGSWQGIDIPLSHFSNVTLDNVEWVRIEAPAPASTVYIDNVYFWKAPTAAGSDASLSDLTVGGVSIADFSSLVTDYIVLQEETTVPVVTATTTDGGASAVVTAATSVPGATTVVVTSQNGTVTETYTVYFTGAAADPLHAEADVISVYSDMYTSIATNLNPGWNQATVFSEIMLGTNNFMKYAGLNYQGLEYSNSDVSLMEYVHFDYLTADASALKLSLIAGGENAYDVAAELGITLGEWVSIDIPMSFFSDAGRDLAHAIQFKTEGNGTVYMDNLYFWKEPAGAGKDVTLSDLTIDGTTVEGFSTLGTSYIIDLVYGTTTVPTVVATTTDAAANAVVTPATAIPGTTSILVTSSDETETATITVEFKATIPATAAPTPTYDAADVISVYSDAYTSIVTNINPAWGQQTAVSEIQIEGNNTLKYSNLNYQGMDYPDPTDVSAMDYIHFDYWTLDATALEFFLIADGENAYNVATETGITTGQWVGVDIPLSYYVAAGRDLTKAFQFKTVGNGTINFDNFVFYKSTVLGTDASLSSISIDAVSIADFVSTTTTYAYEVASGVSTVPTVDAMTTDANATYVVTAATGIPGSTTIVVTAEDGTTTETYTINFTEASNRIELNKAMDLTVYPNPASDIIHLRSAGNITSITVYDISGRNVLQTKPSGENTLNVSALNEGIYVMKIEIDGIERAVKFQKN